MSKMKPRYDVCCGIDLHKDLIVACVLVGANGDDPQETRKEFGARYDDLQALAEWIKSFGCEAAVMESTGVYWQAAFFALSDAGILCFLVNASQCRNLPGKKSDYNDAAWLAKLMSLGMLRESFVPNEAAQDAKMASRALATMTQDIAALKNRTEKLLQQKGIKLSSVLEDIFSVTGMSIMRHIAENGSISEAAVVKLRNPACHSSAETIHQAIKCKVKKAAQMMLNYMLDHYETLQKEYGKLEKLGETIFEPYKSEITLLGTIPGIGRKAAYEILGEIGADMSFFPYGDTHFVVGGTESEE